MKAARIQVYSSGEPSKFLGLPLSPQGAFNLGAFAEIAKEHGIDLQKMAESIGKGTLPVADVTKIVPPKPKPKPESKKMSKTNTFDSEKVSPKALEIMRSFSKTTGHEGLERTVEELAFAVLELTQIVDTQKDPLLEPEAARRQMETMRGVLQRFKRSP